MSDFKIVGNMYGFLCFRLVGSLDGPTYGFDIVSLSPELSSDSDYEFDGKLLVLPIKGHGNCSVKMCKFTPVLLLFNNIFFVFSKLTVFVK